MITRSTILTILVGMLLASGVWYWQRTSRNLQADYEQCLVEVRNYEREELNEANCRAYALFFQSTATRNPIRKTRLIEQMVGLYSTILTELPDDGAALYQRAGAYVQLDANSLALDDYNRLIELEGNDVTLLGNRAAVHEKLGNSAEALTDYQTIEETILTHHWADLYSDDLAKAQERIAELSAE